MKEKPVILVQIWAIGGDYSEPVTQKTFRTFKAAENFAKKWGMKDEGYDPEISCNQAANELLMK